MSVLPRLAKIVRVRHQVFFEAKTDATRSSAHKDLRVVLVTKENVGEVTSFRDEKMSHSFASYLAKGEIGVYAIIDDAVVGHAWVNVSRFKTRVVNGYALCGPGDALIHHCNVDPRFRGRGIYPFMLNALVSILKASASANRILVDTNVRNHSSIRGIEKGGFDRLGQGWYLQFAGRTVFKWQVLPASSNVS